MSLQCETDVSGGQLPNSAWDQYLLGQKESLKALRAESEWENKKSEPLTEANQLVPQIRALIRDLEQAQWKRLGEIGLNPLKDDTQTLLNSARSHDGYFTSLHILNEEAKALYLQKRASINMRFRGFARLLRFEDLPDEILSNVATLFCERNSGLNIEEAQTGVQNLRLTCWRLCNASSHLLIHTLKVKMNHESLSRLEEVSHHPTISKGVRMIQINLVFYGSIIAEDVELFRDFQLSRLRWWKIHMDDLHEVHRQIAQSPGPQNPNVAFRLRELKAAIDKCMAYDRRWATIDVENSSCELPDELLDPLVLAHAEYKRAFEQQEILRLGTFAQAVAKALAKLPSVTSLEVLDLTNQTKSPEPWVIITDPELLMEGMRLPATSEIAVESRLGKAPWEQIVKLQLNFQDIGIMLTSLHIHLSAPDEAIGPALHEVKDLTASIQKLKSFVLTFSACEHLHTESMTDNEYTKLGLFLSAILDTASLESLDLDFDVHPRVFFDASPPKGFGLFQLIGSSVVRKWKRIKLIHLDTIALTFEELEEFSNHILNSDVDLRITNMDLLTGLWVDAIDMLRKHCGPKTTLLRPYGRGFVQKLTRERINFLFRNTSTSVNGYLRGDLSENSLRDLVEEDENLGALGYINFPTSFP